jgi:hypothetical protein
VFIIVYLLLPLFQMFVVDFWCFEIGQKFSDPTGIRTRTSWLPSKSTTIVLPRPTTNGRFLWKCPLGVCPIMDTHPRGISIRYIIIGPNTRSMHCMSLYRVTRITTRAQHTTHKNNNNYKSNLYKKKFRQNHRQKH